MGLLDRIALYLAVAVVGSAAGLTFWPAAAVAFAGGTLLCLGCDLAIRATLAREAAARALDRMAEREG